MAAHRLSPPIQGGGGPVSISGTPGLATVNHPYSFTPSTSGGSGAKTFALIGTLPSGLSFNTATGAITGTPTVTGSTSGLSIAVTDDSGTANLPITALVVASALGPTTASFSTSAAPGTVISTVTGLAAGETVTGVTPNDGRLAIASGNQLVVGLSASSAGTINAVLTTSAGRTLNMAVTVNAAVTVQPVGISFNWSADGLVAPGGGVGAGIANAHDQLRTRFGMRIQPTALSIMAMSGTSIGPADFGGNSAWINPTALTAQFQQFPGFAIMRPWGANDNLLATDPGANANDGFTTNAQLQVDYDAVRAGVAKAVAAGTKIVCICPTAPSNKANEKLYRNAVWAGQKAQAEALAAANPGVKIVFAPLVGMLEADGSYVGSKWSSDFAGRTFQGNISISGTTLTLNSTTTGTMAIGRILVGDGIVEGTTVTAGSGTTWTVSIPQTVAATTAYAGCQFVHGDSRFADFLADAVYAVTDPLIESKTDDEIMDMIVAGTYPMMSGAALDADAGLAGTAGTVTASQGMTGSIATSKLIVNTTGASGIVVSQVATSGGRTKTRAALDGVTTVDGVIRFADKSNINFSAVVTPGQSIMSAAIYRLSGGFRNFGAALGAFTNWARGSAPSAGTAVFDESRSLDKAIMIGADQNVIWTNAVSFAPVAARGWAAFFAAGTSLVGKIMEWERPNYWKRSNRLAGAMAYIGDIKNGAAGYLLSANYRMQPRGTYSASTGGTLRHEPGRWNLEGLTEADFASRRFWKGGTAGQAGVGTGTPMDVAVTGSTWTQALAAGLAAQGDQIYTEITDRDGVTWRSTIAVTVAA